MQPICKKNILVILIFIFQISYAQFDTEISVKKLKYDTTYIEDISDILSVRVYNIWKESGLRISNIESGKVLDLKPNGSTNLGFGFNYKWLGLGFAFGMPGLNNDNDIYGKTDRFDMQMNMYGKRFGSDLYFQRYKGYYINNPHTLTDWQDTLSFPKLKNMELFAAGASVYYFVNNKQFSYRAAFVRNEIQKKSKGSLILGTFYGLNIAVDTTGFAGIMPDSVRQHFDLGAFVINNYGLSVGYAYTLTFAKYFFVSLTTVPGLGMVHTDIYTSKGKKTLKPRIAPRYTIRFAFGFERRSYYAGLTAYTTGMTSEYSYMKIKPTTSNIKLFFGLRFGK